MSKNPKRFAALYLALLFAFAIWILLDSFVIARPMTAVVSMGDTAQTGTSAEAALAEGIRASEVPTTDQPAERTEPIITENSWAGNGIRITLSETRYADTTIHLAEVELADSSLLHTALAENTYGRNISETVAEMAEAHGAILAINGDYYGSRRRGYVLRNGVLYRSSVLSEDQEDLCIWPDGSMTVIREGEVSAEELLETGARQVLSFGPALVLDGKVAVDADDEVGRAMASNPRTAMAMYDPLHYLFVVSDGRTDTDEGLSLRQLAEFLQEQGVRLAYNLDGGGSSTMVYLDEVINWPTTTGRRSERAVSDIVYIGTGE